MTRVFLHTFGCKANQYDTEMVRQALEASGATVVSTVRDADAAVINSCAVTHVSERKLRGFVRRMARENDKLATVITGCAAALDDGRLARLPSVVKVVGGSEPAIVLDQLGLRAAGGDDILRRCERGTRAWLKVQDGCDEHCTFCATTVARGANRSRAPHVILEEARALAQSSVEIVLTGVHIGTYGCDLTGWTLGRLVAQLVASLPRVRFRLSSVEATEVDARLEDLMVAAPDRLAPHLHAPLQSGSDRVLKRMGRHWYTARTYRERVETLSARLPHFGLGADVIVGFPGETEADHRATRQLILDLPFTYAHVFPYSERPAASAKRLGPPVHPERATERSTELREMVAAKAAKYRAARTGTVADIVTIDRANGRYEGLTEDYLPVSATTVESRPNRYHATVREAGRGLVAGQPR